MNITEIIKNAFIFPSKNAGKFAIYLLLSVLMTAFALGGALTYGLGIFDSQNYLFGGFYLIISMLIAFVLAGYHISIIKSGIELNDKVPSFELFENFMTGAGNVAVAIFYTLIPSLIVLLIVVDTNLIGNAISVVKEVVMQIINVYAVGDSVNTAVNAISPVISNFVISLAVTITAALILYIIFSILQSIAEARFANTGSVREALNIFEALKDIKRIGVGRTILLCILLFIIISVVWIVLFTVFSSHLLLLIILAIILTPYLGLATKRAIGLLYSDIA